MIFNVEQQNANEFMYEHNMVTVAKVLDNGGCKWWQYLFIAISLSLCVHNRNSLS